MLTRRQFLVGGIMVAASAAGCARPFSAQSPGPVPEAPAAKEEGPRPFRVALLSDPHCEEAGAINAAFERALADYRPLRPDLWLVNGDVSNNGLAAEIAACKKMMAKAAKLDNWLVTTGNHDFYDKEASDAEELRRFRETFGLKTAYSNRVAGGLHFVMLADEQYKEAAGSREWAWLTAGQLRWFEQVLQEHRDKFTVVCLHQPLQDTVVWSHGGNAFAGCGQVKELRAILKKNPQVRLWLSGHTHMGAEVPGSVSHQGGVAYVGLGSTYYQFVQSDAPEAKQFGGFVKTAAVSQSRMLEVWPDRVVVRARDHGAQSWMDKYEIVLKRA